jgi:transcriptional regulator
MTPDPLFRPELLQGTLDLLVLRTLGQEPMHGYAIAQRIRLLSGDRLDVPQGSLYPSLRRLENQRLIRGEWAKSPTGREARVYHITANGRRRLKEELHAWREISAGINLVIGPA